jgi:predicted RNA-binding protein with PUA-like domain
MTKERCCWLLKSEPDCFSIQDLAASPKQTTCWDGVRNYQARNFMRDSMKQGDRVLFYHSSTDPPSVAGTAVIVREAYPDDTAWDPRDQHYDPKASPKNPIWQMVDIKLQEIFGAPVAIGALRTVAALKSMELLRTGSRLSVQPVSPLEFDVVVELAHAASHQEATPAQPARAKKPAGTKSKRATTKKRAAKKPSPAKTAAKTRTKKRAAATRSSRIATRR